MKLSIIFICRALLYLFLISPTVTLADNTQRFEEAKEAIDLEQLEQSINILKSIEPVNNLEAAQIDQLLGEIYLHVGKPSKALEFFEHAVTSIMDDGEAMAGLAEASYGVGKLTQAKRYAQSAIREDHDLVRAHLVLAKIETSMGSAYSAKKRLEKLFKQKAGNEDIVIAYADFTYDQGDEKKALGLLSDFTRKYMNAAKSYDYYGRLLWLAGYEKKAVKARERAGKLYEKQGNNFRAQTILNWVLEHKGKARRKTKPGTGHTKDPNLVWVRQEPIVIPTGYRPSGSGSGFIILDGSHIVTNHHVVKGADKFIVRNGIGEARNAVVVRYSLDTLDDLAVLKLDRPYDENYAVPLEMMGDPVPGRQAMPMGYPLGALMGLKMPAISNGIVSKTTGFNDKPTQFQLTSSTNKGNSGGPIFDQYGNLLGVLVGGLNKTHFLKERGFIPSDISRGIKISRVFNLMGWTGGGVLDTSEQEALTMEELYQEMLPKTIYVQALVRR